MLDSKSMPRSLDRTSTQILNLIAQAHEPLETKEIELLLKNVTRVKVLYRLGMLRGDGLIKGKPIGSGKGTWVWWKESDYGVRSDYNVRSAKQLKR